MNPGVAEAEPTARIERLRTGLSGRFREASVLSLAGLAMAAGTAGAAIKGAGRANASEIRTAQVSGSKKVQEYAKIVVKNSAGDRVPLPQGTFILEEKCKDGNKPVSRRVIVRKSVQ